MDTLLSYYQQFMELSKINPIMSGIVGVWVAGVITWSFRNVPMRLWSFTKRQCIRHVNIVSVGPDGNNENYNLFLNWYQSKGHSKLARTLQLLTMRVDGSRQSIITAGYSTHYFFFKGHLYWFSKSVMTQQQGNDELKETITVSGLFVSQERLLKFIDEFKWVRLDGSNTLPDVYLWRSNRINGASGYWHEITQLRSRNLSTVAISKQIREEVMAAVKKFDGDEALYADRGIAYKLTFEFTGPTGTGKTSFIRALATYFKRDLYIINLKDMKDDGLLEALLAVRDGSFVLFEDYDSCQNLWKRTAVVEDLRSRGAEDIDVRMSLKMRESGATSGPTLQGFLNAIDGAIPLHNCIIFFTANTPDVIDPAVRRKGRMDKSYELGPLDHESIVTFIKGIFPEARLLQGQFEPISGANLSGLMLDNSDNLQQFVDAIPFVCYYDGMRPMGDMLDSLSITAHFDDATYHLDGSDAPLRVEPPLARGMQPSVLLVDESPFLPNAEMRAIELVNGKQLYPENGH